LQNDRPGFQPAGAIFLFPGQRYPKAMRNVPTKMIDAEVNRIR
jgi:hypothetical protein